MAHSLNKQLNPQPIAAKINKLNSNWLS